MPDFMSAKEAAEKWNISQRRVSVLCSQNRISGAMMVGNMWIIPSVAQKPVDKRTVKRGNKKAVSFKPFVKWVGGKGQLIGELKKTLEAAGGKSLGKYCEPMVGGGALLFYVLSEYNFREIFICDSNAELINAYMAIKDNPEELISKLAEMQSLYLPLDENGRNRFYYSVRDKFNNADKNGASATEKAAYFIFLNKTCFNGLYRVNKKGKFNVPAGAYKNPAICDCENLRNIH
ncbi:MAG: Dam family site-specific DNA-(adenine-N6)-methyltransferase, partial [Clostridia bacterium]|nr:Dam family site-specific DNA-(adenine-N6)-methyltransferase [Clostridia bacterium]